MNFCLEKIHSVKLRMQRTISLQNCITVETIKKAQMKTFKDNFSNEICFQLQWLCFLRNTEVSDTFQTPEWNTEEFKILIKREGAILNATVLSLPKTQQMKESQA